MTNPHPIAEQDSLELLIARLRDGDDLHSRIEAADTLSQMRAMLDEAFDLLGGVGDAAELRGKILSIGTTKIEKDAQ